MPELSNYPSIVGVTFKFIRNNAEYVLRVQDNTSVPIGADTPDGRQYAAWLAAGNVTLPADGPSADETAVATAMTARQATLTKINANFPTSWANLEARIDSAILLKNKTNAAWVANNSRDGVKLLIDIAMFCLAKLLVLIIERQDRR